MKLSTKRRIRHILDNGVRWRSAPFLFWALTSKEKTSRLSVLGSRKLYPKAVERNRIKRLTKQSWKAIQKRVQPSLDILVLPQAGIDVKKVKEGEAQKWLIAGLAKKKLVSG